MISKPRYFKHSGMPLVASNSAVSYIQKNKIIIKYPISNQSIMFYKCTMLQWEWHNSEWKSISLEIAEKHKITGQRMTGLKLKIMQVWMDINENIFLPDIKFCTCASPCTEYNQSHYSMANLSSLWYTSDVKVWLLVTAVKHHF